MPKKKRRVRTLKADVVKKLADVYEDSSADPYEFGDAIGEAFGDDDPLVFHWFHPNLDSFMPVLCFDECELVWDVANELEKRWAPKPHSIKGET